MLNVPEPANSLSNQIENATQRGGAPAIGSPTDPEPDHAERPAAAPAGTPGGPRSGPGPASVSKARAE